MFTGLIEAVGTIEAERPLPGGGARLTVRAPMAAELIPGESIAVDGVCLTVADPPRGGLFVADLSPETLARTTLGTRRGRRKVNLERSLQAGARLGGHIVQGHVDDVTKVVSVKRQRSFREIRFAVPPAGAVYLVEKGSIAIDGISLTIASLGESVFGVAVIPKTLEETVLEERGPGAAVNLEYDVLAKYVERILVVRGGSA